MKITLAVAMGVLALGLVAWHLDPIFATTQAPMDNQALAEAIQDLKKEVQRLDTELMALKQIGVTIVPVPGRLPRVPQNKSRTYPWDPYYDGFAFEPQVHFIGGSK